MPERDATTPASSLFPDADLVAYVTNAYGPVMGVKCEDIFNDDPEKISRFANSIRRSLTNEIARKAGTDGFTWPEPTKERTTGTHG